MHAVNTLQPAAAGQFVRDDWACLQQRGKPKLVALTAVVRKLLHAIYGMFRHRQPLDGARLFSASVRAETAPPEEARCS